MGRFKQHEPERGGLVEAARSDVHQTARPEARREEKPQSLADLPSSSLPFQVVREERSQGPPAVFVVWHALIQHPATGKFMNLPFKQFVGTEGAKGSPVAWGWPLVELIEKAQAALKAAGGDLFSENVILRESLEMATRDRERLALELDRLQTQLAAMAQE